MSAPRTNIEKQERKHRPALWGIWGGLALVAIMLVIFIGFVFMQSDGPEGAETQIEVLPGGSVETEETEAAD